MPANPPQVSKATLTPVGDASKKVTVHFNPASLVYSLESSAPQQASDPQKRQYAATFTGKLTMDLQFDTTPTGDDVRGWTKQVAAFLQPVKSKTNNAPPALLFEWGTYKFQGVLESFRETIDFFSADGIPLRALVSIGMARQDKVFDDDAPTPAADSASKVPTSLASSVTNVATQGGDPRAARQIATDNGLDSLRFTGGVTLDVSSGAQLNPAAGFVSTASAGGGLGLSLGVSAGAGVGVSTGASAGVSVSGGVSAGVSAGVGTSAGPQFGASASAGVPATAGAFAGIQVGRATVSTTAQINPTQILQSTAGADVSTFSSASFSLGGAANSSAGAGLTASVGAGMSFSDVLVFDNDD